MGWILDSILEVLHNLLSELLSFISMAFASEFQIDLALFDRFFPLAKPMQTIFIALAIGLFLLVFILQLFKNFLGPLSDAEAPAMLLGRFFLTAIGIFYSYDILLEVQKPFNEFFLLFLEVDNDSTYDIIDPAKWELLDATGAGVVLSAGAVLLIKVIFLFLIFGGFVSLVFQLVSKYITMCALFYTAPLAFASLATQKTSDIFKSWSRMFGCECLLMILNLFFIKVFVSAIQAQPGAFTHPLEFFIWNLCLLAWLNLGRVAEAQLSALGISTAKTGKDLGASLGMAFATVGMAARFAFNGIRSIKGAQSIAAATPGSGNPVSAGSVLHTTSGGGLVKESAAAVMNQNSANQKNLSITGNEAFETAQSFFGYSPTGTENITGCRFEAGYACIPHLDGTKFEYFAAEGGNAVSIPEGSVGQTISGADGHKYHMLASGDNQKIAAAFGASSFEDFATNASSKNENIEYKPIGDFGSGTYLMEDKASGSTYQITSPNMYEAFIGSETRTIDGHNWTYTDITPAKYTNLPTVPENADVNVKTLTDYFPSCSTIEGQKVVNAGFDIDSSVWTAYLENGESRYIKQSAVYRKDEGAFAIQNKVGQEFFISTSKDSIAYGSNKEIRAIKKQQIGDHSRISKVGAPSSTVDYLFGVKKK